LSERVRIAGVGMTPFVTPKQSPPYPEMVARACQDALADAGVTYWEIQQVFAGYVYGDSTSGQRAVYEIGLTGVPIINVNNNCSTGSTALFLARSAILAGADCVLALGFEQMPAGALVEHFADRPSPLDRFLGIAARVGGDPAAPIALRLFGAAGREYQRAYGTKAETFANVTVKARRHASRNPKAVFRNPVTVAEVLDSPLVFDPLTRLMCCPPTCGAAAAVLVSEEFARRRGLSAAVEIRGQAIATDTSATFAGDMTEIVGRSMSAAAAKKAYEAAGVGPGDVQVIELHDCFTSNELISYEALGLVPTGEAERLVRDEDNTFGGRWVINPSGGLLSKGHPLGATGLAQCYELVRQLRGDAGPTQVAGVRFALQHNIGLGGACVVTVYGRA
jgi:sterol carrier protein 2